MSTCERGDHWRPVRAPHDRKPAERLGVIASPEFDKCGRHEEVDQRESERGESENEHGAVLQFGREAVQGGKRDAMPSRKVSTVTSYQAS